VPNKSVSACEAATWHLHLWPIGEEHGADTECQRIPFACRSWRHEGECRKWRGALDWWRVREAVKTRNDWVYVVLTFRQPDDELGRWKTYLQAGKSWDIMRKRIVRSYGKLQYIQTLERHSRGGCHCNVLLGNHAIAKEVELDWKKWRSGFLKSTAVSCGFGPVCWVERVDDNVSGIAGYLTKLANELTGSGPKNQVPVDAPPHFRRIRASRGLLPKKTDPELTGQLVKVPIPEYDYTRPDSQQTCGSVGRTNQQSGKGEHHATNKSTLESTRGPCCRGHGDTGGGNGNARSFDNGAVYAKS